jgi:hypothetical protein
MRQFMATVGVVVFGMAFFGAIDAKAQGFVFGGPLVFEDVPYVNVGISGDQRLRMSERSSVCQSSAGVTAGPPLLAAALLAGAFSPWTGPTSFD